MKRSVRGAPHSRATAWRLLVVLGLFGAGVSIDAQQAGQRTLEVGDLFALKSVRAMRWSADGGAVSYEVHSTRDGLNVREVGSRLHVWPVASDRTIDLSALAKDQPTWGGVWSPDGSTLAFLVAAPRAAIRLGLWSANHGVTLVEDPDIRIGFGTAPLHWADDRSLIVTAWPDGATRSGRLYQLRARGERAAELWAERRDGGATTATATVLDTAAATGVDPAVAETLLVRYSLDTGATRDVHRGVVNRLAVAPGGRFAAYFTPSPGIPTETVDSFLSHEDLYSPVNWGTALTIVDLRDGSVAAGPLPLRDPGYDSVRWSATGDRLVVTGAPAGNPEGPRLATWAGGNLAHVAPGQPDDTEAATAWLGELPPPASGPDPLPAPSAGAAAVSVGPTGVTLFRGRNEHGDRLVASLPNAPGQDPVVLWTGNAWVPQIALPAPRRIDYVSEEGQNLTAWLITPPGDGPFPTLVHVYPGTVYGDRAPASFTRVMSDFTSPLLFVARGYAVLAPSIPEGDLFTSNPLDELTNGVLPALDAAVATGLVDDDRLVVQGQSGGGYATLGLIGKTDRFRAAIASASYSDLESLYGTFYGQMRFGDGGHPQRGQVLRISQMEKGFLRLGGPPWELPERYRVNSPITFATAMTTPLLLIHGDMDFIPIQQAEQMFTALYRLGRDVRFLRYHGEQHTIAGRANVEHMWREIDAWLERQLGSI